MNLFSILSTLFDRNVGNTLSKDHSVLFCNTIQELLSVNTPDAIIQQVLLLYSTYRNFYQHRDSIQKKDIAYYNALENKLKIGNYKGGTNENQNQNQNETSSVTSLIQPKVFKKLYSNWLQSTKDYLKDHMNKISGSSNDNSNSSNNPDNMNIQQIQTDEQFNEMFSTLGVIYGSLLQFLKDLHTINSEYDLDITGFVDETSKLKPICELAKYAVSVVSLIDAVLEIIVNQGVLDIRLLKPILRMVGINFDDIEYYYNEAIQCIFEFQNMNDMSQNKIINTMKRY